MRFTKHETMENFTNKVKHALYKLYWYIDSNWPYTCAGRETKRIQETYITLQVNASKLIKRAKDGYKRSLQLLENLTFTFWRFFGFSIDICSLPYTMHHMYWLNMFLSKAWQWLPFDIAICILMKLFSVTSKAILLFLRQTL